jgi:hypothetical protein
MATWQKETVYPEQSWATVGGRRDKSVGGRGTHKG